MQRGTNSEILNKNSLGGGDVILPKPRNMNLCYLIIKDTVKDEKHNSLEKIMQERKIIS